MSINSPLMPGSYSHRSADCENAVERDFFRIVGHAGTAFIDIDHVLAELAEDATRAGWSEEELTDAVHALARRYGIQKAAKTYR